MFWIGILVGATFVWFAIKLRFYQTWALVFNIIISIYLAVYLRPTIVNIPAVGDTPYNNALTMVVIAVASFLILHGISYIFLTSQFNVSFPKIFDTLGSGLLGFLAGFLVWSFLSLLIYITPASQNTSVKGIFTDKFQKTTVSYVSRFCNLVNALVSSQDNGHSAKQTISKLLLKGAESKTQVKQAEPEKPVEPAEPNEVETSIEEQLGPPPEIDLKDI
jgi:hypothetical protein